MTVIIGGSGTANGIASFSSPAAFGSTLSAAGSISQGSAASFSLASGQLTFPATQNASSDANTLDDYKEGTWTPDITGGSSNPTVGYSGRYGHYTKIGNRVFFNLYIAISSFSGGSGAVRVSLPFTATGGIIAVPAYLNNAAWATSRTQVVGIINGGSTFYFESIGNNMGNGDIQCSYFNGNEDLSVSGHYPV